jgi:signal peptidase I
MAQDIEATDEGSAPQTSSRGWIGFVRDLLIILLAALVVSFLIKTFLIRSFYIPSASMEDTLQIDDRIIVNQLTPALWPLERGDVVVFEDPGGWLPASSAPSRQGFPDVVGGLLEFVGLAAPDTNDHLIKRVIGLPGDTVACCDEFGRLTVNGVALDETYTKLPEGTDAASQDEFEVTVPDDALWVMGDNRYNSQDSRYNRDKPGEGFVPMEDVVGRAIVISWPFDRWAWLDNHSETFVGIDEQ